MIGAPLNCTGLGDADAVTFAITLVVVLELDVEVVDDVVERLDVVELVLLVVDDVTDVVAGLVEGGTFENEFWALESTQDGKFPSGTQSIALF